MQLDNKNIKQLLTVATCALLGTTAQAEEAKPWAFDTALMYYGETDRVTAIEAVIAGTKEFEDDHFLSLKLTYDTLTGASANGAIPQNEVQTFTRPSGNGEYQIEAGKTPLDDTFKDSRAQFNAQWTQPITENYTGSAGFHLSKEFDYLSIGVNGNIARDFNQKNTTVSVGFAYSNDTITPKGGLPDPFTQMLPAGNDINRLGDSDTKTTVDVLFGVTQVINRQMLMQVNYSLSQVSGYQTDPFKIFSVVNESGDAIDQLYESRPDSRTKHSIYWQTKYHLTESIVDFSYRYMWDDWEISSNTFELKYHIPMQLFGGSYVEPHLRYYSQEAAEFYQPFIVKSGANLTLPEYMTADYRMGEMTGLTLGVKYGMPLSDNRELSFRVELFQQTPKNPGVEAPGQLADLDLYESVQAIVAQVSYSF